MKHAHPSHTPSANPPFCLLSLEVQLCLSLQQFTPSCPFLSFGLLSPPTLCSLYNHKVLLHIFAAIYCAFHRNGIEWQRNDIMKERKYVESEGIFAYSVKSRFYCCSNKESKNASIIRQIFPPPRTIRQPIEERVRFYVKNLFPILLPVYYNLPLFCNQNFENLHHAMQKKCRCGNILVYLDMNQAYHLLTSNVQLWK